MKQSVFKQQTMDNNTERPCKEFHGIGGHFPGVNDVHLDGKTCDCGKLKFYKERCGCPANVEPTYTLKSKPNE